MYERTEKDNPTLEMANSTDHTIDEHLAALNEEGVALWRSLEVCRQQDDRIQTLVVAASRVPKNVSNVAGPQHHH